MTVQAEASRTRPRIPSEIVYAAFGTEGITPPLSPVAQALNVRLRSEKASLPAMAIAVALWRLRDQGVISLDLRRSKSLGFIPKTELIGALTGNVAGWGGIESELLAKLAEKDSRDVGSLVADWYGHKKAVSPEDVVQDRIRDRAIEAGIVDRVTVDANRGLVGRAVLGDTKQAVVVDPDAFAAVAPTLDEIATGWAAFTEREPDLARELVARVNKAIERKAMSDNDSELKMDAPDFD